VIAFGTLTAAGLPLTLAMTGLVGACGLLFLLGHVLDVTIWAMNFALIFAIALGIDYALLLVVRFRAALAAGLAPVTRPCSRWPPPAGPWSRAG
jgi:RND superfamily putative drug exporter